MRYRDLLNYTGRCLLTAGTKAELNPFMEANNLVKKHAYAILGMSQRVQSIHSLLISLIRYATSR